MKIGKRLAEAGFRYDYDELFYQFCLAVLVVQHKKKTKDLNLLGLAIWQQLMTISYPRREEVMKKLVKDCVSVKKQERRHLAKSNRS